MLLRGVPSELERMAVDYMVTALEFASFANLLLFSGQNYRWFVIQTEIQKKNCDVRGPRNCK